MNEPLPQFLVVGQDVLVVGHDKKAHRAKVIELFSERAARCESLDGQASSLSEYSETGEVNTFHFPKASGKAETKSEAT